MARTFGAAIEDFGRGLGGQLKDDAALAAGEPSADTLQASQEAENIAAVHLLSGDRDVRELAAQQLAAGAALDLAACVDYLKAGGKLDDAALSEEGSQFDSVRANLGDVIAADSALGLRSVFPIGESAGLAKTSLADTTGSAVDSIAKDAAAMASDGVEGLGKLGAGAIISGLGETAESLLGPIYEKVTGFVRIAMKHLAKAVSKLLHLLGPFEEKAREWLKKKIEGVGQDEIVTFIVDKVLDSKNLKDQLVALAEQVSKGGDSGRTEACRDEVEALAKRFGHYKKITGVIAFLLDKLRPALLAIAGWIAAALAGVYGLLIVVAVWVAGDYLDWERTKLEGKLDLVYGVRHVLNASTTPA